jgi:hypothetical protein
MKEFILGESLKASSNPSYEWVILVVSWRTYVQIKYYGLSEKIE